MKRWPKSPPLMTLLTKNPQSPSKKVFEFRLEGLPLRLLSLWTALYHLRRPSYVHAKPRAVIVLAQESMKPAGRQSVK